VAPSQADRNDTEHDHPGHHDAVHEHPLPGTPEYDEHVRGEIAHYEQIFESEQGRETLLQPVPPSWGEVERRASDLIVAATGRTMPDHIVAALNSAPGRRMLSLGCGPGGLEISFAEQARDAMPEIVALDLNASLLAMGQSRAAELGLALDFQEADLNTVGLPPGGFDLVFCHASLHHVIELERLAAQIAQALRPGGSLITVDVITRNGYRMWPETREVVSRLFRSLPERFRVNHTAYGSPRPDEDVWEADTSAGSMECVRSEDILGVLRAQFREERFVPYFAVARRFFDTMYGPNYDLDAPLDRALFEWIWQLDRWYLENGELKPETFFGIYRNP
jgi:ubiquinone/menaquinone biosynthesis C-methylase UbiE